MSYAAMMALGVAYMIITILCLVERRGWDALYWIGALLITASLIGRR